jgi:hypothetical protein
MFIVVSTLLGHIIVYRRFKLLGFYAGRDKRLKARLLRRGTRSTLLSSDEVRRTIPVSGAMYRGRRTVEVSRIVGSVGKHEQFDQNFMPLPKASPEKWKRIDRAFRLGQELPPVSLLELGGNYFVNDGHHRVSVARFHGVEWIDAEVTECKSLSTHRRTRPLDLQCTA